MSVKRCLLQGRRIHSLDDLYDELTRCLTLPDYFGRNLDALWDVLAADIEGPLEIVWQDAEISRQAMGADFAKVATLFNDLELEREDVTVRYR
jgi:ribonuclease inhibitor